MKQTGVCLWDSVLLSLWCVVVIELHLQTSRKSTILKSKCIKPATFHYFQETCLKNSSRTPDLHCQMLFWFIILTSELCIVSVLPLPWWWRPPVIVFAAWVMSKMGPVGLNFTTLSPAQQQGSFMQQFTPDSFHWSSVNIAVLWKKEKKH